MKAWLLRTLPYSDQAVLAMPTTEVTRFRVVEVIKGDSPPSNDDPSPKRREDAS